MARRSSLADLRFRLLYEDGLDDEWRSPNELCDRLGLGRGLDYYRVALVCERLAADGRIEIQASGNRRKFRR